MTLHEELNNKPEQCFMNLNLAEDQANEQKILNNFMNYYNTKNKSIFSDLFYGAEHSLTKCSNCTYYKHNFQLFCFLVFFLLPLLILLLLKNLC